jgi:hypothetical protein
MNDRLVFNTSNIRTRWVAYFDLLGFRNFVKDGHIVNTFFQWEKCLNTLHNNLGSYPTLEHVHFSDIFLIYAPDDSRSSYDQIGSSSRWFFQHAIMKQIPLRGALGCGPFYADKPNGVFLGKALVDAYDFGERFNWIGYMLSPSAISRMQHSDIKLPSCPVHFRKSQVQTKSGSAECVALLCGGGKGRDYIRALEQMKQWSLEEMERNKKSTEQIKKVAEKYDNTLNFIRQFETKN